MTICRQFISPTGCERGAACPFVHAAPESRPQTAEKPTKSSDGLGNGVTPSVQMNRGKQRGIRLSKYEQEQRAMGKSTSDTSTTVTVLPSAPVDPVQTPIQRSESAPREQTREPKPKRKPRCRYYASTGGCKLGDECPFSHEQGPKRVPVTTTTAATTTVPTVSEGATTGGTVSEVTASLGELKLDEKRPERRPRQPRQKKQPTTTEGASESTKHTDTGTGDGGAAESKAEVAQKEQVRRPRQKKPTPSADSPAAVSVTDGTSTGDTATTVAAVTDQKPKKERAPRGKRSQQPKMEVQPEMVEKSVNVVRPVIMPGKISADAPSFSPSTTTAPSSTVPTTTTTTTASAPSDMKLTVAKPTVTHFGTPFDAELSMVKLRYPTLKIVNKGPPTSVALQFDPSDPDFPFDIPTIHVTIHFPLTYPQKACSFKITNLDIPEKFKSRMERTVEQRSGRLLGSPMVRQLLTFLDNRLEEIFTPQKLVAIEAVAADPSYITTEPTTVTNSSVTTNVPSVPSVSEPTVEAPKEVKEMDDTERFYQSEPPSAPVEEPTTSEDVPLVSTDEVVPAKTSAQAVGTRVSLESVKLDGVGVLVCTSAMVVISCDRCRERFDMTLHKDTTTSTTCTRCHSILVAVFFPEQMHEHAHVLGHFHLEGCSVADFLPSDYRGSCLQCGTSASFRSVSRGNPLQRICHSCFAKLVFAYEHAPITKLTASAPAKLSATAAAILAEEKRKKKEEQAAIQVGHPLPNQGACKHYKKSYRWFRFPCCGKAYACDQCHDEKETHEMKLANRMICGFCSTEQQFTSGPCKACDSITTSSTAGKNHWEGGKGVRDQTRMSVNDPHKYAGTNKTISRKKLKDQKAKTGEK